MENKNIDTSKEENIPVFGKLIFGGNTICGGVSLDEVVRLLPGNTVKAQPVHR